MRELWEGLLLGSLAELAHPLRGIRVLYYGGSGLGFPGGDGVAEAVDVLPQLGVQVDWTHAVDPNRAEVLAKDHDVAIICNTRIGELLKADRELWDPRRKRALWFWDLRPGTVGAPLRGKVDHVFLSYNGPWTAPDSTVYEPRQWAAALGCPVGYAPQAAPLRTPVREPEGARILFVGDLSNRTYHAGRADMCRELGVTVLNERERSARLGIEAQLPRLYRSSRYVLSMSPRAPGYTSVRTYSILACGGRMLLHRFPGCERLFRNGEHAIIFDTAAELSDRLELFDKDESARELLANAGRRLHAQKHTIAHRILSMCRELTGISTEFAGWL